VKLKKSDYSSKESHLLAGAVATRMNDFKEAEKEFKAAFSTMRTEERDYYQDISALLPEDERAVYRSSSRIKRIEINRRFWVANDPSP